MDDIAGQQDNVDDTDHGESDELQNLRSHDEVGNTALTKRQYTFNQHIEIEDPSFRNTKHVWGHLYNNFSVNYKGLALKNCLWHATRATTIVKWQTGMNMMMELDGGAYDWLSGKPASQWSKSHFKEGSDCDMLLNNLCETFNCAILAAREKPILSILEHIRVYLVSRIVARLESCERWSQ
ncbi:Uncharacterized protein Adt_24590 [Abeliophyllum distichum]|uniref:Uncharacterized protein n=1 Tax=Abeliophyllum distichum TaxID=126358 RepID=A0ABD1SEE1_9LAMI